MKKQKKEIRLAKKTVVCNGFSYVIYPPSGGISDTSGFRIYPSDRDNSGFPSDWKCDKVFKSVEEADRWMRQQLVETDIRFFIDVMKETL